MELSKKIDSNSWNSYFNILYFVLVKTKVF